MTRLCATIMKLDDFSSGTQECHGADEREARRGKILTDYFATKLAKACDRGGYKKKGSTIGYRGGKEQKRKD